MGENKECAQRLRLHHSQLNSLSSTKASQLRVWLNIEVGLC